MKKVSRLQYLSLLWIARILGMFYAILMGLFSLDAVKEGNAFWDNLLALSVHLIPFILIILALIIGWHKILITGLGFILLSVAILVFYRHISLLNQIIVIGPGILNGLLFIVIYFIKPAAGENNPPSGEVKE